MIHFTYFIKNPIRIVYALFDLITKKQEMRNFVKNSQDAINALQSILSMHDYLFYFDFGTLIGIYRERRLLQRDMDIDVSVHIENQDNIKDLRAFLESEGFNHKYIFLCDNIGIIQDTFKYKGVTVDINYYHQRGDNDYCYLLYDEKDNQCKVLQWRSHHINTPLLYDFNGIAVNIPDDPEQHLADRYGPTWRIPDPSYKYWDNPMAKRIDVIGRIESLAKVK